MAETSTYIVKLQDQVSAVAKAAAAAVEKLEAKLKGATGAAAKMGTGPAAKAASGTNWMKFAEGVGFADKGLGKTLKHLMDLKKGLGTTEGNTKAAGFAMTELGELLGKALPAMGSLAASAMAAAAAAIAAGVIALYALGAAALYAFASLAKFALTSADAARSQQLAIEGMLEWNSLLRGNRGALAGASEKAAAMSADITRLNEKWGVGVDKLMGWEKQLSRCNVTGQRASKIMEAVSIVSAAAGDEAAQAFFDAARAGGLTADAMLKIAKTKFGEKAARQMLSLEKQFAKLQSNLVGLFKDIPIEGFLAGLDSILSLFSQTTASGQAIKKLMEVIFNPLFAAGAKGASPIKDLFRGMLIGALQLAIAVMKARKAISEFLGEGKPSSFSWLSAGRVAFFVIAGAAAVAAVALVAITGVLAVLAVALLAVAAIGMIMALPFIIPVLAIMALIAAIVLLIVFWDRIPALAAAAFGALAGAVSSGISAAIGALSSLASAGIDAAANLIAGLVSGIQSGTGAVIGAIQSMAGGAIDALKSALQSHSPSRVMMQLGGYTSQGFAQGIEDASPQASRAMDSLVSIPREATSPQAKGGAGTTITIGSITITGVKDAEQLRSPSFTQQLAQAFELALQGAGA